MRMISSVGASVGYDDGSPVSDYYKDEYTFSGVIERVGIEIVSVDKDGEKAADEALGRSIQARQ
jgi:arylsulfatase